VQFLYESPTLGPFRVALTRRSAAGAALEIDAVFQKGRGKGTAAPPPATQALREAALATAPATPPPTQAAAPPPARTPVAVEASPRPSESTTPSDTAPAELAALLARAVGLRASDLHLLEGAPPLVRVGGELVTLAPEPTVDLPRLLGPSLGDQARRRLAEGSSLDVAIGLPSSGRFRANVYQTATGLAAALRLLSPSPPALGELGLPVGLDDVIDLPHGLVLVCGATGSGKSTTLAALAEEALRRRPCMLVTLEDPIEYVLPVRGARGACRQRQVGRDVRDFATGLRDALREDPDLLLIGEMRDPETIGLALTAAETGHLVLASLHSRSAASAVERIVDTYAPERQQQIRVQLADALRVVVAQRLVPRASGEGRVLAVEVLRATHAVASAIRDAKTAAIQSAIQAGKRDGMIPLERCLADLVQRQRVSLEAARAAANDPGALGAYLAG
jgi:twitching motility protein PilT